MQPWRVLAALLCAAGVTANASADEGAAPTEPRTEIGFVPLVGGDTDIGIGLGFLTGIARLDPAVRPYRWRIESAGFFSFKVRDGGVALPYQDVFVMATIPRLWGGRLRLELRPSFTRETNLRYYGIGNGAPAPENQIPARDFYQRTHPALVTRARLALSETVFVSAGGLYTGNWVSFAPESTLARDLREGGPEVRELLLVDSKFGLALLELGVGYDRRDEEISTTRGQYHTFKVRSSIAGTSHLPYDYVQTSLVTRFFFPLVKDRLVFVTRQVLDAQFGNVPFFELGRFAEESSALGGANGVRGIPADRYLGKLKVFGNVEFRWHLKAFEVLGSQYMLGVTSFLDGGRVWADFGDGSLDGEGLGIKYGLGGGVRVQKGRTFVIRTDVAWSPDARPIGAYFLAGQIF